jgi:hypothetical protein
VSETLVGSGRRRSFKLDALSMLMPPAEEGTGGDDAMTGVIVAPVAVTLSLVALVARTRACA